MTRFVFRPPTDAEVAKIRTEWCDGLGPRTTSIPTALGPDRYVRIGRFPDVGVSPRHWYAMHKALVRELTSGATRLEVVAFSGVPDVAIGWSCSEGADESTVVHWIAVAHKMSRHGIGRALLDRVFEHFDRRPLRLSHITLAGAQLVGAWQRHNPHAPPAWIPRPE